MIPPLPTEGEIPSVVERLREIASTIESAFGPGRDSDSLEHAAALITRLWEIHKRDEGLLRGSAVLDQHQTKGILELLARAEKAEAKLKDARGHVQNLLLLRDDERQHPHDRGAEYWLSQQDKDAD